MNPCLALSDSVQHDMLLKGERSCAWNSKSLNESYVKCTVRTLMAVSSNSLSFVKTHSLNSTRLGECKVWSDKIPAVHKRILALHIFCHALSNFSLLLPCVWHVCARPRMFQGLFLFFGQKLGNKTKNRVLVAIAFVCEFCVVPEKGVFCERRTVPKQNILRGSNLGLLSWWLVVWYFLISSVTRVVLFLFIFI